MQSGGQTAVQVLAIPPPSCNPIAVPELLVGILHDVSRAHQRFWEIMHTLYVCVTNVKASALPTNQQSAMRTSAFDDKKVDFLSIGNFVEKCKIITPILSLAN
jgi:hypothetical protein